MQACSWTDRTLCDACVWRRRGASMPSNGRPEPIVETPPHEPRREETGDRALGLRIRQQEILAELGVLALKGTPFNDLLREAVRLSAQGLEAEFCKVLEYMPAQNRLLMRAGVGWDEGLVGTATIGADLASPSGYALHTGKPVISNHLASEERFRTPDLLAAHGVRRAINVILQGDGAPYGVLEVDSRSAGEFSERDIAFLQGAANVLGMAIERQRQEQALKTALEHNQVLLKEINHRVKNSLQMVANMLRLQAGDDPHLGQRLRRRRAGSWRLGAPMTGSIAVGRSRKLKCPTTCRISARTLTRSSQMVTSSSMHRANSSSTPIGPSMWHSL